MVKISLILFSCFFSFLSWASFPSEYSDSDLDESQLGKLFILNDKNLVWKPDVFLATFYKRYPKIYSLDAILERTVRRGFESQTGVEDLYQAYLNIMGQVANLTPSLQVGLTPTAPATTLLGLLGVFVPSNWFNLSGSEFRYRSQQLSLLSILFTQYHLSKNLYYQIHQAQIDVEIYRFYIGEIKKIIRYLTNGSEKGESGGGGDLTYLLSTLKRWELEAWKKVALVYQLLPELSFAMGLPYNNNFIDIGPLTDPLKMDLHLSYDNFIGKVVQNSYEIISMESLKKEKHSLLWATSFNFLSLEGGAKISIGGSWIKNIFLAKSEERKIDIQCDKVRSKVGKEFRIVVERYNYQLINYSNILTRIEENNRNIKDSFTNYFVKKNIPLFMAMIYVDMALSLDLSKNDSHHQLLINQSEIDRLTHAQIKSLLAIIWNEENLSPLRDILINELKTGKVIYTNRN